MVVPVPDAPVPAPGQRSHLTAQECAKASLVQRSWRSAVSEDDSLWRTLLSDDWAQVKLSELRPAV